MKVILCAFNLDFKRLELLKICLYSIHRNTDYEIFVFYDNTIEKSFFEEIRNRRMRVRFIAFDFETNKNIEVASQKMFIWDEFIKNERDGENVILSDMDTLYLDSMDEVFDNDFDIAFTAKDDMKAVYPLNTGIVFVRVNDNSRIAINKWKVETEKILNDSIALKNAMNVFGGADQKALSAILGRERNFHGYIEFDGTKFYGLQASVYNLHKDWSNIQFAKMIHYKSSWKDVLNYNENDYDKILLMYKPCWFVISWKISYDLWKSYQTEYYSEGCHI
jgi:hypothetical protein